MSTLFLKLPDKVWGILSSTTKCPGAVKSLLKDHFTFLFKDEFTQTASDLYLSLKAMNSHTHSNWTEGCENDN